ncbi:hypothetical protein BKI52_09035 [marine bacterium AO1-C]|nr:hypothetical protein BKI52_09035 [marine bacterium AO1-C]
MINYAKPRQFVLLILAFVVLTTSCNTQKDEITPTDESLSTQQLDLEVLSANLADDQSFKAYLSDVLDVYIAQSNMIRQKYQGNINAYQQDMTTLHATNERQGWNETKIAEFDTKMGLAKGKLLGLTIKRQQVFDKFPVLSKLSETQVQEVTKQSLRLATSKVQLRTSGSCEDNCKDNFASCLANSSGGLGFLNTCSRFSSTYAITACFLVYLFIDSGIILYCNSAYSGCMAWC